MIFQFAFPNMYSGSYGAVKYITDLPLYIEADEFPSQEAVIALIEEQSKDRYDIVCWNALHIVKHCEEWPDFRPCSGFSLSFRSSSSFGKFVTHVTKIIPLKVKTNEK